MIWFCEEYSSVLNISPIFVLGEYNQYREPAWMSNRFDCLFVMLILWSQPNLGITWIIISSYASSSWVRIGHHRITRPNQCSKIIIVGVYAWEGKNSADQLKTFHLYEAGCMVCVACMLKPHTTAFGIAKAVKYCDCGRKHMIVLCNNLVTEEKKCDGFLQMWIYFHCRMIICGFKTILYWIFCTGGCTVCAR